MDRLRIAKKSQYSDCAPATETKDPDILHPLFLTKCKVLSNKCFWQWLNQHLRSNFSHKSKVWRRRGHCVLADTRFLRWVQRRVHLPHSPWWDDSRRWGRASWVLKCCGCPAALPLLTFFHCSLWRGERRLQRGLAGTYYYLHKHKKHT